jgi:hypothetical protein
MEKEVTLIESGQDCAYGDTVRRYLVCGAADPDDALSMAKDASGCKLSQAQWREENKANPTMENYFRASYTMSRTSLADGAYLFTVTMPYTG